MKHILLAILLLLLFVLPAHAGIVFLNMNRAVDRVTKDVASSTKKAVKRIENEQSKAVIKKEATEEINRTTQEYEKLAQEIVSKAEEIENQRLVLEKEKAKLLDLKNELENEKLALKEEVRKLETEKADLKRSKAIYSTGLFASIGAIFLGLIGFLSRRPLVKLEMKLKELEIKEKEIRIETNMSNKTNVADVKNPCG